MVPVSWPSRKHEECQTNCVGFHADLIARHAVAMKAADPTIKTMFSSNEIRPHILEEVRRNFFCVRTLRT